MAEPKLPPLPRATLERFRSALSLPDEKLRQINDWSRKNKQAYLSHEPPDDSVAETLGLSRESFFNALGIIGAYVLSADDELRITNFIDELAQRGLADLRPKLNMLLDGIEVEPRIVQYAKQRALGLRSVLPTLESVDAVCDLRGIFGRYASPSRSESYVKGSRDFLGFEPVLAVSLSVNDASGAGWFSGDPVASPGWHPDFCLYGSGLRRKSP